MQKPARAAHTYTSLVVGLLSFASVFLAGGIFALVFQLRGARITGLPGCLFVLGTGLTIIGFVFSLAGRIIDHVRAIGSIDEETGEIRQPLMRSRNQPGVFTGVTGRRYGTVPMVAPRSDPTTYGNGPETAEQGAVKADASELSLARVRRLGKWVSNAAPTR